MMEGMKQMMVSKMKAVCFQEWYKVSSPVVGAVHTVLSPVGNVESVS